MQRSMCNTVMRSTYH